MAKGSDIKAKLSKNLISKKVEKPRDVVCFDIGSNTTKIVEGKYSKSRLQVYRMYTMPTPEGTIEDGKIINEMDLKNALGAFLRKKGVKIKDAVCTTNSSSIISREIVIPVVEEDEIDTVIKYEIEQYLPIRLEDYVFQHKIIEKIADSEGAKYKVNVVAYPQVVAKSYFDLLTALDMNPFILDVNFNSLNKISSYSHMTNGGTVAFVDMGATSINVTIFKDEKIDFTRIIKYGGNNIDYALSTKLDMSIKATESEKIEKASLIRVSEDDVLNLTLEETMDDMLGELERILQFYNNQSVGKKIENIIVFGGTSNIEGIERYMERKLNIKTIKVNSLSGVDFAERTDSSIGRYLNALGAIIRM